MRPPYGTANVASSAHVCHSLTDDFPKDLPSAKTMRQACDGVVKPMEAIERSVAYKNQDPQSPTRYASHPSLTRLSDGRLLLIHRVGSAKWAPNGNLHFAESADEGRTWELLGILFDGTINGKPAEGRLGMAAEVEPGRILLVSAWVDRSDPNTPLVNEETEGLLPIGLWLSESTDGGRTWDGRRPLDVSPLIQPFPGSPPLMLPDGRLAVIFETYKHYTDPEPWIHKEGIVFSGDGGRTWGQGHLVPVALGGNPVHWDHRMTVLPDGTLLDLFWLDSRERRFDNWIYSMTSSDCGRTWSEPTPTGIPGQMAVPLALADGRVMMIYVCRDTPPSIRGRLSEDGGKTWDACDECVLYAHRVADLEASRDAKDFGEYISSMKSWSFGWPSAVQLPGGDVVFVHYAGDEHTGAIHCVRVAV